MNQYQSVKELKAIAREQLLGKYGAVIFVTLLVISLKFSLSMCATLPFTETSLLATILYEIVAFLINLFLGVVQVGVSTFYLNFASNRNYSIADLFHGFKSNPDIAIKITFCFTLIQFLCSAPYMIYSSFLMPDSSVKSFCILFGLLILSDIAFFFITIPISQVYFLYIDLNNKSVWSLIKMSNWLMKGSKMRYILLQLSFLPLYLFIYLSCGIGYFWVIPYINTTDAYFYLNLTAVKSHEQ